MTVPARLRKWFSSRGFKIRPGVRYAINGSEVFYRPGDPAQTQIRGLLHEAGHVLYCRTKGWGPPKAHVERVREEIEAWDRGWHLGKRMRFRLDPVAWWQDYRKSVLSHMRKP